MGKSFEANMCWCCMCMSVGSGEWIVFQLASLFTGYLIFVCDCCRNFLLPIGAVGRNSFTAQREKLQNVYRKRNHFEGFGVQQTCWEFHWVKIEKLFSFLLRSARRRFTIERSTTKALISGHEYWRKLFTFDLKEKFFRLTTNRHDSRTFKL